MKAEDLTIDAIEKNGDLRVSIKGENGLSYLQWYRRTDDIKR